MLKMRSPHEEYLIKRVVDTFSTIPEVKEIILYGSRARGDSKEDSDMDILLVYEGELNNLDELKRKALPDMDDYLYVSITPYPARKFFSIHDPFMEKVRKEGESLWKR